MAKKFELPVKFERKKLERKFDKSINAFETRVASPSNYPVEQRQEARYDVVDNYYDLVEYAQALHRRVKTLEKQIASAATT